MSRTIWKYPVSAGDFTLELPRGGEVLAVDVQYGDPFMWVLVNPDAILEKREF